MRDGGGGAAGAAGTAAAAIPWDEAVLPALGEAGFAAWRRALGERVVEGRGGRHWVQPRPGFWQPVHLLARLPAAEAVPPSPLRWGFRARLADGDAATADGAVPVHLLPNLAGYGLERLSSRRRRLVKAALREADHVALASPDLLLDQGRRVAAEANAHAGAHVPLPGPEAFRAWALSCFGDGPGGGADGPPRALALAAVRRGELLAFSLSHAVDGSAYQDALFVGAEGRRLNLALSLFHALAAAARRTAGVAELMNGQHAREDPGLDAFKRGLGLEVAALPARVRVLPPAAALLRRARPDAHYRLTGRG